MITKYQKSSEVNKVTNSDGLTAEKVLMMEVDGRRMNTLFCGGGTYEEPPTVMVQWNHSEVDETMKAVIDNLSNILAMTRCQYRDWSEDDKDANLMRHPRASQWGDPKTPALQFYRSCNTDM